MEADVLVVFVTVPDEGVAESLSRVLLEERLAACVNRVEGLRSWFRWQGEVDEASELLLIVKTTVARFDSLRARVQQLHPYDLPEILALPVWGGSAPYLDWVRSETGEG